MSIRNAIASVAVKDLKSSLPWYERLVGRGPDRTDEAGAAEWVFEQGGRLQLHQQPARAGLGSLTFAVGNLDTEMLQLNNWGITPGDVIRTPAARILNIDDPDGNTIALTEILPHAPQETVPVLVPSPGVSMHGTDALERALESIAADVRLNPRDALKSLDSVILDLEGLLRATDENMHGPDSGLAAQLLQRAHVLRDSIVPPPTTA